MTSHLHDEPFVDLTAWLATTAIRDGSWWTAWTDWLGQRSGEPVMLPPLGRADSKFVLLGDAPGRYVLMT
jgi:polyhydroxyalkanoate synthase subunit PhaC